VNKDGLTLARVYDLRDTLLPPFIDSQHSARRRFWQCASG
jgi:hypothetical protein